MPIFGTKNINNSRMKTFIISVVLLFSQAVITGWANNLYDYNNQNWQCGWNVSGGVGFGDAESGVGLNASYGSVGWSFGIGGYYDWHAWDDNPVYEPEKWGVDGNNRTNNCYTYALDWIFKGKSNGLNPGNTTEKKEIPIEKLNLNDVLELALTNNKIKKPTLLNKLGFGKRGYYSVYLVVDEGVDYHWYRQDKGGLWSHKHGTGSITNVDGSGRIIGNPARANHCYRFKDGTVNYNNGGILLWVRRK